jgi:hypothetical protein
MQNLFSNIVIGTSKLLQKISQKGNEVIFTSRTRKRLSSATMRVILFASIVLSVITNLGMWLALRTANIWVSSGVFLLIFLSGLGGLLSCLYYANLKTGETDEEASLVIKPKLPEGYRQIFSQPVDPIGNLYLWRVTTEIQKDYLAMGPEIVAELENYLERHCDIHRVGAFGEIVQFNDNEHIFLYEADDSKEEADKPGKPANRARVKIIEPGWVWGKDQILRRPRVR